MFLSIRFSSFCGEKSVQKEKKGNERRLGFYINCCIDIEENEGKEEDAKHENGKKKTREKSYKWQLLSWFIEMFSLQGILLRMQRKVNEKRSNTYPGIFLFDAFSREKWSIWEGIEEK